MNCEDCLNSPWGGRHKCRAHIEDDTRETLGLLRAGKITKGEILTKLVPIPSLEEISQAIVNGSYM